MSLAEIYDQLATTYAAGRHLFDTTPMLEEFFHRLPATGALLDAGCGAGVPVSRYFVERGYEVTGVDISPRMLAIAQEQVPGARFLQQDMREPSFPDGSFVGVVAVYSVFHLGRHQHQALFQNFARMLQPGGTLLLTLATREYSGQDELDGELEFLGYQLPYSHDRPEVARDKLRQSGFSLLWERLITTGGETFYWVIAGKPVEGR